MCIALISTAHPDYALIVLDNRDEYVLRPTSRPRWWIHRPSGQQILSAKDLQRRERGTWMGVSKTGRLAVLTNYRETIDDHAHPIHGVKSRGGMVTAWLGAPADTDLDTFVAQMLEDGGVKGVGGFSLICGDLRLQPKQVPTPESDDQQRGELKPLAIISNRSEAADSVPRIGGERGKTWGLSNTIYEEWPTWAKVQMGNALTQEAIAKAVAANASEDELCDHLFAVLDHDTLPPVEVRSKLDFESRLNSLKNTIFVSTIGNEQQMQDMDAAVAQGKMKAAFDRIEDEEQEVLEASRHDDGKIFDKGAYGTQRQTIVLVDWEGNVTYKERALFDAHGNTIQRGQGDVTFKYAVDG